MSKRPSSSSFYGQSKIFRAGISTKQLLANDSGGSYKLNPSGNISIPTDTEAALLYLKAKFPVEKFEGRLPPVILVHQVYSIIKCRTTVDKDIVSIIVML